MPRRGNRRVKRRTHHIGSSPSSGSNALSAQAAVKTLLAPVKEADIRALEEAETSDGVVQESKYGAPSASDSKKNAVPRSIVVRHGRTGQHVAELVEDLRAVMSPNTALKLRERKNAALKDYVMAAGPLGVSHLLVVTQATKEPTLRIARLPQGPTMTFRVMRYSLSSQIREVQTRIFDPTAALETPPLVVLNNFDEATLNKSRHLRVVSLAFQSMFPSINVKRVQLASCRRVLLLHLNEEDETIEVRHYQIRTKRKGVSKPVKKIIRSKLPDLSHLEDIGDMLDHLQGYTTSDSEMEDEDVSVMLQNKKKQSSRERYEMRKKRTQTVKKKMLMKGTEENSQAVVQLSEIGPRMRLFLIKIEDGVFKGEVQYHAFEERTKEEIFSQRREHKIQAELKAQRKLQQEKNVEKKRKLLEEKKERRAAKRQKKLEESIGNNDTK